MTNDEARIVAAIVATADDGCTTCRDNLLEQLRTKFPDVEFPVFGWFTEETAEILK